MGGMGCQLARKIRESARDGQFAADSGEAVFGRTEPGQPYPHRFVVTDLQARRCAGLAFALVD